MRVDSKSDNNNDVEDENPTLAALKKQIAKTKKNSFAYSELKWKKHQLVGGQP